MQVTVAAAYFSGRAPSVEQGSDGRKLLQRSLPELDDILSDKTGLRRRCQAAMVRLDDSGQRRSAAVTGARFGCLMERRDMVGELVHQGRIQSVGLGELIEQRLLVEAAHHHDPIDHATLGTKADPSIRSAGQRSDLQIKLRRRAAVEHELGLAGYPALFRGREVKVGKLY